MLHVLAVFLLIISTASTAFSVTSHIDCDHACGGNTGTTGNPYCSPQEWHNTALPVGGDIGLVHNGTCATAFTITRSGDATNGVITLKNAPGEAPLFNNANSSTGNNSAAIFAQNARYWRIEGLTFDGTGVYVPKWAIRFGSPTSTGMTTIQLVNNIIRDWGINNRTTRQNQGVFIFISNQTSGTARPITNVLIQGNYFDNNPAVPIMLIGTIGAIVEHNTILNTRCLSDINGQGNFTAAFNGIKFQQSDGSSITPTLSNIARYNYIGPPAETPAQCSAVFGGTFNSPGTFPLYCDVGSEDGFMSNNWIAGWDNGSHFFSAGTFTESRCSGWRVSHNFLENNGLGYRLTNSGSLPTPWPSFFFNNIIYGTTNTANGITHQRQDGYMRNNLVYLTGTGVMAYRANCEDSNPTAVIANVQPPHFWNYTDNNRYYVPNVTNPFQYVSTFNASSACVTTQTNFTNWQATANIAETSSSSGDPLVVNPATYDFNGQSGSPLIGAGAPITNVVINRQQQLGTVFAAIPGMSTDIGIQRIQLSVGGSTTLSTLSVSLPFLNIYENLTDCTPGSFTLHGSSGSRTGVATSCIIAGNTITLGLTGSVVAPLVPGETITVDGVYGAVKSIFAGTPANTATGAPAHTILSNSRGFTGQAIINTLTGTAPPTIASCIIPDTPTDVTARITFTPNVAGVMLPATGGLGPGFDETGTPKTMSGTCPRIGDNEFECTVTAAFSSSTTVRPRYVQAGGNITGNTALEVVETAFGAAPDCLNQVAAPPVAPTMILANVQATAADTVLITVDPASGTMIPASGCTGFTISADHTVVSCTRVDVSQYGIIVAPPFMFGESTKQVCYTQSTGNVTNGTTELAETCIDVINEVPELLQGVLTQTHARIRQASIGAEEYDQHTTIRNCLEDIPCPINPVATIQVRIQFTCTLAPCEESHYVFQACDSTNCTYTNPTDPNWYDVPLLADRGSHLAAFGPDISFTQNIRTTRQLTTCTFAGGRALKDATSTPIPFAMDQDTCAEMVATVSTILTTSQHIRFRLITSAHTLFSSYTVLGAVTSDGTTYAQR